MGTMPDVSARTPLRWRGTWNRAAAEKLIAGTPVDCIVAGDRIVYPSAAEIQAAPLDKIRWDAPPEVLCITGAAWPRVRTGEGRDEAAGGPTGIPWVDANGWIAQLAHAVAPEKAIWIAPEPPQAGDVIRPDAYALAVADSAAFGATPLLTLDDELLRRGEAWRRFTAALAFFKRHAEWRSYQPVARLGLVSAFTDTVAQEILNLAARRHLPYRLLPKSRCTTASFEGLAAVAYLDDDLPAAPLAASLGEFGRHALLIASPKVAPRIGASVAREWDDPYAIAAEIHVLMSRRQDVHRLYNATSCNSFYAVAPGGRAGVVHIVNYSLQPGTHAVTLWLERPWREARLWTLDSSAPLKPVRAARGIELPLPPFGPYAAIELGA